MEVAGEVEPHASHKNPILDVGLGRIAVTLDVKGAVDLTARTALTDSYSRLYWRWGRRKGKYLHTRDEV